MGSEKVDNRWLEKNVDLSVLAERIKPFFYETDFETFAEKTQEGYVIRAISRIPNLRLRIEVSVRGEPNDFRVKFSAGSKRGYFSPSMIAGYLTMMFGGGYLVSREVTKRETLDLLENDFWRHIQMQVADLVDSATDMKGKSKT
jgi:hypothetical protein